MLTVVDLPETRVLGTMQSTLLVTLFTPGERDAPNGWWENFVLCNFNILAAYEKKNKLWIWNEGATNQKKQNKYMYVV